MLQTTLSGTTHRFDDLLTADGIDRPWHEVAPLGSDTDFEAYCTDIVSPEFARKVSPGDFLVGEFAYGRGHDLEYGAIAAKSCGIAAVLCDECTPYFLRNSFHRGLLTLEVPGISGACSAGNRLTIDLHNCVITNVTTQWQTTFSAIPDFLWQMLDAVDLQRLHASS